MSKKFEEYISADAAEEGLRSGRFVSGVLRVNPKKPSDGFCVTGNNDVLIKGKLDRNRAFNGDTIVVEIFPPEDWHRTTDEDAEDGLDTKIGGLIDLTLPDADKDEILLEAVDRKASAPIVAQSLAETQPPSGTIKTGRVVYVSHAVWKTRVYACVLQPNRTGQESSNCIGQDEKLIRAVPIDKRIPWILIQLNDVVKKILGLPGTLDPNLLYPIQVQKWQETGSLPLGRIKGVAYGKVGEPEVEAKVCLSEAGLDSHQNDFPKSVHDEVAAMEANFQTELAQESQSRIDLRSKRVFTIDPATARDLDDAIDVEIINDEFIQVGVHIADVAHYVKENSEVCLVSVNNMMKLYTMIGLIFNDETVTSASLTKNFLF
jgi:exoribonuclease R